MNKTNNYLYIVVNKYRKMKDSHQYPQHASKVLNKCTSPPLNTLIFPLILCSVKLMLLKIAMTRVVSSLISVLLPQIYFSMLYTQTLI